MCGQVSHTQNAGTSYFIHSSKDKKSFYGMPLEYYWDEGTFEDDCVRLCGVIETNYGRPRIEIAVPDKQVYVYRCP